MTAPYTGPTATCHLVACERFDPRCPMPCRWGWGELRARKPNSSSSSNAPSVVTTANTTSAGRLDLHAELRSIQQTEARVESPLPPRRRRQSVRQEGRTAGQTIQKLFFWPLKCDELREISNSEFTEKKKQFDSRIQNCIRGRMSKAKDKR